MAGTGSAHLRPDADPLLSVQDLVVEFPTGRGTTVHAVSGVSFDVLEGETVGLVGESGCGKSSTGRAVLQLPRPTSGSVRLEGQELTTLEDEDLRRARARMQMIFQDPISSLNPRRRIEDVVAEGLTVWGMSEGTFRDQLVNDSLRAVGLDPDVVRGRRSREFSGGQCQRICIARALVLDPKILICDEPVASLDVSVQAQIVNLLEAMKQRYGLTMIFVAHDLAVVKRISDRVIVMYLGKICEIAPADQLFADPQHPYTRVLLESIPVPDPHQPIAETTISGELPSPLDPPSGCRFRTRCPKAQEICATTEPTITENSPGHFTACHFPEVSAGP